jgi:hypothetical protein
MQYNRGRQAAITNELVDIITGAFYWHNHFSKWDLTLLFNFLIGASALWAGVVISVTRNAS